MDEDALKRNEALQAAIDEAGLTYEQVAADVRVVAAESGHHLRTSRSNIAHWIKGQQPSPRAAQYLAEAMSRRLGRQIASEDLGFRPKTDAGVDRAQAELGLAVGPNPIETLRRLGDADINRRTVLVNAAYSVAAAAAPLGGDRAAEWQARARRGRRVGRADIQAVQDMTRLLTAIDERHGGQHGRTAVIAYLREDVAVLCQASFTREQDRAAMLSAAANVAYLCGWKAYDSGEHGLSQRYYLQAYALCQEAGDDLHAAWVLRILAHNGMDIRRPEHTVDLAEAALSRVHSRVDPATEALFVITRARALAVAGEGPKAVAHVRTAQNLLARGEPAELPLWAALWGSPRGTVGSHTAKTFQALGDHANAERHYAESAKARPSGDHQRIAALTIAALGREQAAQGHLEQACATWTQSLHLMSGVRSVRAADAVAGIRRHVRSYAGRGIRAASDLDEQARAWQLAYAS